MRNTRINDLRVFSFSTREELLDYADKEKKSLIAINAEKILHATEETRSLVNKNIGYADGFGAVWALKKRGFRDALKIPGCELWLDLVRHFCKVKTFYLVGGEEKVIQATVKKLKRDFPNIQVVGYRNGYLKSEAERNQLFLDIATNRPDVVFVAMGSPKQELLMQEMQQHHTAIYQGLGGSFDIYVGNVQRAPVWWVDNNLEWAFRLIKEPSRIKRQIHLVRFLRMVVFNRL